MGFRGCVLVGESFLSHDKWQIKLLSEFLFKSHSTFYKNSKITNSLHCNHKIRVQECNGGGATSCQWCHMISHDIISVIGRGWGVSQRGVCHAKLTSLEIWIIPHISTKINYILTLYALLPILQWNTIHEKAFEWLNYKINHVIWNSFYWCHLPWWCHVSGMAGIQANFELWPISHSIYLISTLNLRPGQNSVAFFTYIVKFPAFKLLSFMAYTYNIKGWWDGTRHWPLSAWPHDSHPVTAPQPHSLMSTLTLSTFNLININYDNLWLHILNVVEGLMWIGKNPLNNFICHLSWLKKLSPTHTYPLISIHEFLKPYHLLFFELESLIKCWMWIV